MVRHILVIMDKEWSDIKTTLFSKGNPAAGLLPLLLISGAVSVYEPLRIGLAWLQSPIMVFFLVVLVPISVIGFVSPDSFVRERRRGTLEPLLATPISDQALLFGKIGMAGLYGWGIMLANMLLSLVTLNIVYASGGILLYSYGMSIAVITTGLLFCFLLATGGVYYSLYATTLLEAQNGLGMLVFVPIVLVALFVSPYTPGWWQGLVAQGVATIGVPVLFLISVAILLVMNGVLLVVTQAHFQRKRLIF